MNINDRTNYFVLSFDLDKVAEQELNVQKLARTNDSVVLRKNYGAKVITMEVVVKDTSQSNLDSRLDTFRKTIEATDKNLDVDYAGGTRRYVSTGKIKSVEERRLNWVKMKLEFTCYKAFGEDTSDTTETFLNKTTSPYTDDIAIGGTAPAQPDITITIDSVTPGTGDKYIQIKNTDNGDYVKITADDWIAGDVVIISTREKKVTRNAVVVEYLGIMPEWLPGTCNWEYSDDFDTARQVDIEFSYKKRYL